MGEVVTAEECLSFRRQARREGRRVVFTNGCFDILHRGHLESLRRARELGDCLVVGLNGDESVKRLKGEGRPIVPMEDRAELVAALSPVDRVVVFEEDTPALLIELLVPDVLVKGGDYQPADIVGRDTVEEAGGVVVTIPLLPGRSTRELVRRLSGRSGGPGEEGNMTGATPQGGGRSVGWRWAAGLILAGAVIACGIHSSLVIGLHRPAAVQPPPPGPVYAGVDLREFVAALHVHTRYSWDGVGTPEQVVEGARKAGVEGVLLAEHNVTGSWEVAGMREGILLVPGVEASTDRGHLLLWGTSRVRIDSLFENTRALYNRKPTAAEIDTLARSGGGLTVLAHPRGASKPWRGPVPPGTAGVEVVNGDSQWRDDSWRDVLRSLLFYPLGAEASLASLVDRPSSSLALWDSLLAHRPVVGTAGLDAHGGIMLKHAPDLTFPTYGHMMGLMRQHLLLPGGFRPEAADAPRVLLEILRKGRHFIGFDCFGSTRGFAFWGVSGEHHALMGERLPLSPGAVLAARLPRGAPAMIRVIRMGEVVAEERARELLFPITDPGSYRVEVYQLRKSPFGGLRALPWIISNPIHVGDLLDTG